MNLKIILDIQAMNKQWIEASHYHARLYRRASRSGSDEQLYIYEYLDIMGLFETGWIVYDFDQYERTERNKFGYPG